MKRNAKEKVLPIKIKIMNGNNRNDVKIGQFVEIIQKQHQGSGELTDGIIKRILTKSKKHPHGIKVLMDTREVGRVQRVVEDGD